MRPLGALVEEEALAQLPSAVGITPRAQGERAGRRVPTHGSRPELTAPH